MLKHLHLFKTLFLLLAIVAGGNAWGAEVEPNWSYTFVKSDASKLNTTAKTYTVDATHVWSYEGTKVAAGSPTVSTATTYGYFGLQFGSSSSKYFSPVILSTSAFDEKAITKVRLHLKHNGSKVGTLTVKQGDITIGTATTANTSDWVSVECSETKKGDGGTLTIQYEVAQALYVNKIEVWYEDLTITKHALSSAVSPVGVGSVTLGATEVGEGKTTMITATPIDGYRFVNWTVTGTGASVADATASSTTFTMGTADATVTANFTAVKKYPVHWSVNGNVVKTVDVEENTAIEFPTAIDGVPAGYTLTGWVTESHKINTPTDTDPKANYVTSADATEEVTYYAVMAVGSGVPSSLTKMGSSDVFTAGDKVVIVATDGETKYAIYQETQNTSWVGKYEFDGNVATVDANDKNWLTVSAGTDGKWKLGDGTNGYLYSSSSNNLIVDTNNSTQFTLAYNNTGGGFTLKYGSRWLSLRTDTDTNKFRLGGTESTPLGAGYFEIYKYVAGVINYSGFCTTVPAASVTVSTANYATFCDNVARNFLASGITVYTAKSNGTTVDLTEVTDGIVPANTGVVLYYNGGKTAEIPAVATDKTTLAGNELIGINEVTNVKYEADGKYNYILSNQSGVVGFYKAAATGANLAAHRAYLSTAKATPARSFLGFADDETTGINNVNVNHNDDCYDLQGRRVAQPTKGLYIVNGKKVVIK